jgi:hypothetical protein
MRKVMKVLLWVAVGFFGLGILVIVFKPTPQPTPEVQPMSTEQAATTPVPPTTPPAQEPKEKTVTVNGAEVAAPNLTPEQLTKARGILTDLRTLHGECGAMPRSDLAKCGDLMRANQPRARALDDACTDLPIQLKLTLGQAATRLATGCSCLMPAAQENLVMATKSLDEAAAILAE